jgi:hypothetical protein
MGFRVKFEGRYIGQEVIERRDKTWSGTLLKVLNGGEVIDALANDDVVQIANLLEDFAEVKGEFEVSTVAGGKRFLMTALEPVKSQGTASGPKAVSA